MQYYETIYILHPDLPSDEADTLKDNLTNVVEKQGGKVHVVDDWGVKRLAYEVKKQKKGRYVLMQFAGDGGVLQELERNYRVNDRVIKYLSLRIDENNLQVVTPKEVEPTDETAPEPAEKGE